MVINKQLADFIGIFSSFTCIIHCILTPFLLSVGVVILTSAFFKFSLLFITFLSIYFATRQIKSPLLGIIIWISFLGLLLSVLFEETYKWLEYLGYFFATIIISVHLFKIKYQK